MALAVPLEVQQQIDAVMTVMLCNVDADAEGLKSSDSKYMVWQPIMCKRPGHHRFGMTVVALMRKYSSTWPHRMHCMACRICRDGEAMWSERRLLERAGYDAVQAVFGEHCMYIYEWRPLRTTRKTVDLLVVQLDPFMAWAIQFDGRQHACMYEEDVNFDAQIVKSTWCKHVVRLSSTDQAKWLVVLQAARRAQLGSYYYSHMISSM